MDTVALAEAVKVELANPPLAFSQAFTPVRTYVATFTSADLNTLQVTVSPATIERSNLSRTHRQVDRQIAVTVTKRVQGFDVAGIDALVNLVEEIADYLDNRALTTATGMKWFATEVLPYDEESLHSKHLFAALITLTYRAVQT